jgi:hypothetical protein
MLRAKPNRRIAMCAQTCRRDRRALASCGGIMTGAGRGGRAGVIPPQQQASRVCVRVHSSMRVCALARNARLCPSAADREREGGNIRKSLLALVRVVNILSKHSQVCPVRSTKGNDSAAWARIASARAASTNSATSAPERNSCAAPSTGPCRRTGLFRVRCFGRSFVCLFVCLFVCSRLIGWHRSFPFRVWSSCVCVLCSCATLRQPILADGPHIVRSG